ncbi:MAG: VanW family protein, partial [Polyangiaceae bacterium]|nr:VanW family protein [Polyangiaceae bacterium]
PVTAGVSIGERVAPGGGAVTGWLERRRGEARLRIVRLRDEDRVFEVTLGEAGVEIDVEATLEQARRIGHEGPLIRRLKEAARARRGEVEVPLAWRVDEARARELLATIAPRVRRAAVDARLDMARKEKVADVPGRELDVAASIEALRAAAHEDEETVDLVTRHVSAAVTLADLTRVDVTRVVSSFETAFTTYGTGAGRAVNIANAASKIDGTVIAPGETFSFNEHVGPRTKDNGFTLAPEIQGDETVTGWGGGTCQVSSTLYAAAIFGALDVIDRQSHSRPSVYTKMGLDATVFYPTVDLRIRNSLPFPVMIHAFLPKPTAIRVELLGGDPVAVVEYTFGIGRIEDFMRRIYVKRELAPGRVRRHQKGTRGYDVTSVATVRYRDGRVDERRWFSGYRPAPEVYWVAPDFDLGELPPLPEHAKGVEDLSRRGGEGEDAYSM